jgi:hypothetical protein
MADSYTEVTNKSWFKRIGEAVGGIVVGIVLFIAAFPVLFWNEGRAVKTYRSLKEGQKNVISIMADKIDPANEGKLVHLNGMATTDETLHDNTFGVSVNALKLIRNVEMYQWKEEKESKTRKKLGGSTETVTTYNYEKGWSNRTISSSSFKHPEGHLNPSSMQYQSQTFSASNASIGEFDLSGSLLQKVRNSESLQITEIPKTMQTQAKLQDGGIYIGDDPSKPVIGDIRVGFQVVKPQDVSLVSQQYGTTFVPYKAKAGNDVELLKEGTFDAESMFASAQKENRILTWILRIAGFAAMFIGIFLLLRPLSVLGDVVPFIGSVIGMGIGLVAFAVAAPLSLITVAFAWIVYRPLLGILLLLIAGGIIAFFVSRRKRVKATAPAQS